MTQARDLADGKFDTDTLVVDAANNRVGVGLASPSKTLHVESDSSSVAAQFKYDGSTSYIALENDTKSDGYIGYTNAGKMEFWANGSQRASLLSSGGLTFNGDTATANALDDYEEGTWTPDLQDAGQDSYTGAYAAQLGKYTKVGNMVTVWAQINASNTLNTHGCTGSESVRVAGLPFTALNDSGAASYTGSATNINSINFPSGYTMLSPSIGKGGSHINLKLAGDNVSDRSLTCTEYQSGEIFLCVNYRAT